MTGTRATMRVRRLTAATVVALLAHAGAAQAQDKPPYLPLRDVTVTYRLTSTAPGSAATSPREAHMYFSAALNKLRLDEPSQKGFAVIDRAAQQVVIVMTQMHGYMVMPFDPEMASGFILNDKMKFTRSGTATVAGLACTRWDVASERAAGTVCVTADGVMLSGRGEQRAGSVSSLEAISVSYSAQPPSLFSPPPDFTRVAAPRAPR